MTRIVVVAGFLCVLTACGQSGTATSKGSSTGPTATPSSPTVPPSPRATPVSSPAGSSTISCRLPVLVPRSGGSEPLGGWVTLPGGEYARDPNSPTDVVNHEPSYDWPLKRW